jgi:DNA-binding transcriptional LysR family regulator
MPKSISQLVASEPPPKELAPDRLAEWFITGRLKLRQLTLVDALGDTLNLHRAARQVHVTEPAASKLLRDLEDAIGTPLFVRSRQGLTPNAYGDIVIRYARSVLLTLSRAREEVLAAAAGLTGKVTVGTVLSTATVLLPRAIARVIKHYPRLDIAVHEGAHRALVDALRRGQLDLLLCRLTSLDNHADLDFKVVLKESFSCVVGPLHPLAGALRVSFAQLVDEKWILPPRGLPVRDRLDDLILSATQRLPVHVIESTSMITNQTLLLESDCVSVLPTATARHYERAGMLCVLPLELDDLVGPAVVVTRRDGVRTASVDAFIDVVLAVAADIDGVDRPPIPARIG